MPDDKLRNDNPAIKNLQPTNVSEFTQGLTVRINELVRIGAALSAEKDIDKLLEMIVTNGMNFTNADGGTLYIKNDNNNHLDFAIVQNITLQVSMGGTGETISWPSVPLRHADGSLNHRNVSAHCAITGEPINIPDVYHAKGFDFQGTKDFDATTGYRSKSMLVIPLRDHEDEVIGVLQLLNAQDKDTGQVIAFPDNEVDIITSLASQAAISITNVRLTKDLEALLNSFVKSIATAIDEKSPYTSGHIQRVAQLTDSLTLAINDCKTGRFADLCFSEDELKEIRMAAWMHDVGKITTPEQVVDKSTKLETIYDRVDAVRYRMEILKRDEEIRRLENELTGQAEDIGASQDCDNTETLDSDMEFIEQVNQGGEFISDEALGRIGDIAARKLIINNIETTLLNDNEIENLSIRKGTLTNDERAIINNHVVVTGKMLGSLPFPKKLANVPAFAAMHHEKLDGSGYPAGLSDQDIPLAARILAVADVFEALTAADRPYKSGKLMSESIRILGFMVKDRHLDEDLCDLLIESGIAVDYAGRVLAERQQDDFEWKGRMYSVADTN